MQVIVVISALLAVASASDLTCLKSVENKFIAYRTQFTELKKTVVSGKGQDRDEQSGEQRASGPIDIFASMGKLPGQLANIFGANAISAISNNLTQMLNNLNLVDQTMQQVVNQIGTIIVPGKRQLGQELVRGFVTDLMDTMGAFRDVIKVVKDILELVGPREP